MRLGWLVLAGLLLPMANTNRTAAMATESVVSQEVHKEIAALVGAEDEAWNRGSAEAFGARVLPDVLFTNVMGMFSVGKAPFVAQHERIFSTIYKGSSSHQDIQHITLLKPDVAIVDTLAILTGAQHAPPGVQLIDGAIHARLEQVLIRRPDGWWVASFHNVAVNPAVVSGAPPKP